MAREITFPKISDYRWTNAETGVSIIKKVGAHGSRASYDVVVPALEHSGWSHAAVKRTLNEARAAAKDIAVAMRAQIARAHREALVAFAIVMADRAEAAITAATHEEALTGEEADRLFGYLTTAKLFRETDPERSIGWSNEILSELAKVADRETGAAKAEAQQEIGRGNKQITDWLDSHGVNFHGATSEGIDETVREYHAGIAADHEEALRLHLAREWYARAGFETPMTTAEVSAGYADWDAGDVSEGDRRDSIHAADLVLSSEQPEIVNYLAAGRPGLALLAIRDTLGLRSAIITSHKLRRVAQRTGRPAGWGAAWLGAQHPGQIDVVAEGGVGIATEPIAGRFFPGPM